jgi:hypothetical protein
VYLDCHGAHVRRELLQRRVGRRRRRASSCVCVATVPTVRSCVPHLNNLDVVIVFFVVIVAVVAVHVRASTLGRVLRGAARPSRHANDCSR